MQTIEQDSQENLTIQAPAAVTGPGLTPEENAPPIVPEKPSGYAGGKFQSVEELEAAYAELEKNLSGEPGKDKPDNREEGPKPLDQVKDEDLTRDNAVAELAKVSDGQLDISEMEREFLEQGALSEAQYEKLAQAGIGRELVDRYINANVAQADAFAKEVRGIAGGEAEYREMTDWARKNLAPGEIASFDKMVSSGDTSLIKLAVEGMAARWRDAVGQPPQLVGGKASAAAQASHGFRSPQEMMEAMRDRRYGKDPAYTRDVEQRVARSNIF